jgi:hypothetical protein
MLSSPGLNARLLSVVPPGVGPDAHRELVGGRARRDDGGIAMMWSQ